ncbi:murein biosynthesis integral membrane protein MurJ [Propionicicella superfundia]|uniref:murein biosynthesis integral membrane protein MurJ n=1 Tax=Propionicicella superfundia TaxID=348582 RepID=UPI000416801D|nr:murein biosynthesis integral membrane protein MurJ [Propionicicella superfundia]
MTVAQDSPSSGGKLLKATAVMASGTLVSRILGFARVMMISFVLGNGTRQADIFSIAQTVPNSLFMLFAGGALNTVLVPQIVRAVRHDSDGGQKFVSRLMTAFLLLLAGITVIMTLLTPWVMSLYTHSDWRTPALAPHWESLVLLAYLTMPQIFFYGAFFLVGQVLNAREKFGPMMWAPAANNVVSIIVFALYAVLWGGAGAHAEPFSQTQTLYLGIGATGGIIVQTLLLVPFMSRLGFRFRLRFDFKGSGLGHTFNLAKWTLLYVGVNQLALMVVDRLATQATVGGQGAGVTAYLNAYLVWILPHSLITVSLATAMLPSASRLAASGNLDGVATETMRTMRLSATFLLPSAIGFVALGLPFAQVAFGHGTGSADAGFVGWTLMAFSLGLVPFTLQYVCLRAFYALEDTRVTFFIQCVIASVNAALAVLFVMPWNNPDTVAPRLAIAFSIAYGVGWVVSFLVLRTRLPGLHARELLRHLARLLVASLPAGVLAWLVAWAISLWSDRLLAQLLGLALGAAVAIVTFLALARKLRIDEVQQTLSLLRRRSAPAAETADSAAAAADQDADTGEPAPPVAPPAEEVATLAPLLARDETPGAIQTYPDVVDEHDPATAVVASSGAAKVEAGDVIADRFRLDELLACRVDVLTWRGFDLTLSRPVLMHVLPPEDPRADAILAAARSSASITDARFLRVLDAARTDAAAYSAYIVCEYAAGSSLKRVLAAGPLSSLESACVVRELADALTWVHALRLYHRQLNPDTVIVTTSGNIKIVGFLIEDALAETPGDEPDGQRADLRSLGRLLYATLVSLYPGGPAFGMPAAPLRADRVLPPRQVVPGIPAALDTLCDQLLNPQPGNEPVPDSALAVTVALNRILGTADATSDLERRVKAPVRPLFEASGRAASSASAASGPEDEAVEPVSVPADPATVGPEPGEESEDYTTATVELTSSMFADTGVLFTPVPPPAHYSSPATALQPAVEPDATAEGTPGSGAGSRYHVPPREPQRRRYWLIALCAFVALVLIGSLAVLAITQAGRSDRADTQPTTAATTAQPFTITRALDFDPQADGGSGDENTADAGLAVDGDPATQWRTELYRGRPQLGGLKPGVGLVVDLGSAQPVSSVTVTFTGQGTTADIKVPITATTSDSPPRQSRSQWRTVATKSGAKGATTFDLATPETTRYVLVYLTSLPADGGGFRGGISEIVVR